MAKLGHLKKVIFQVGEITHLDSVKLFHVL